MFARFKVQRMITYSATILLAYKIESFKVFSSNSFPKSNVKQLPKVAPLTWKSISDNKQTQETHRDSKIVHTNFHRWAVNLKLFKKTLTVSTLASKISQKPQTWYQFLFLLCYFLYKTPCSLEYMWYITSNNFHP